MTERFDLNNTKYKFKAFLISVACTLDNIFPDPEKTALPRFAISAWFIQINL